VHNGAERPVAYANRQLKKAETAYSAFGTGNVRSGLDGKVSQVLFVRAKISSEERSCRTDIFAQIS
jgi:hypothetical protein